MRKSRAVAFAIVLATCVVGGAWYSASAGSMIRSSEAGKRIWALSARWHDSGDLVDDDDQWHAANEAPVHAQTHEDHPSAVPDHRSEVSEPGTEASQANVENTSHTSDEAAVAVAAPASPAAEVVETAPRTRSKYAVVMLVCPGGRFSHHCASDSSQMETDSVGNKRAWACQHGYEVIVEGKDSLPKQNNIRKIWGKVVALQKHLAEFDYIMWIDLDSVIRNPAVTMEQLIAAQPKEADLLIARDWNGLNFGVAILRNTPWMHKALEQTWGVPGAHHHVFQEQFALERVINQAPPGKVAYVPLRSFNAYPPFTPGIGSCPQCVYRQEDLLIHFPGCGDQRGRNCEREFYQYFDKTLSFPSKCQAGYQFHDLR